MGAVAIATIECWADAIVALPVMPLPSRVAIVPSEAHAHALRVELATRAARVLAGTRFLTVTAAAQAVLDASWIEHRADEESRRRLRVREVLRDVPLASYRREDLVTPGWEEELASAIDQLEAGAIGWEDLERLADPRASDLAAIWRALDADAGTSWSAARIVSEAAALLARDPSAWPFGGHVLGAVSIGTSAGHARLLRAIPRCTLGVIPGRPARTRVLDRARALLGDEAASLIPQVQRRGGEDELAILTEWLYERPDRLAVPGRRRSRGPDGSVTLELFAGVDEELDAAARWVADQVFAHHTPLQRIGVLVPAADPIAPLLADRIRTLPWPAEVEPVYLACGRPAAMTAAGARLLALVDTLVAGLPADGMAELLPRLRLSGDDGHVTPGRARAVVESLGTLGGSPARPRDALRWRDRLAQLGSSWRDRLAELELDGTRPFADLARQERPADARVLEAARGLAPALEALVAIADRVLAAASLGELWRALRAFVATHLIGSRDLHQLVAQLDASIVALAEDRVTARVAGIEALELVSSLLRSSRVRAGRYGDPAIYVGTIADAAGLPFEAVRVIGLAESAFPRTLRQSASLPATHRRRLPAFAMFADEDHAAAQLHALDQIIRGTASRLALSAPRSAVDGSEREPASVFVEVAAALGRTATVVPTISELERSAFSVARTEATARRAETPLSPACWLDRVARDRSVVPSAWSRSRLTDPSAVRDHASRFDGVLGPEPLAVSVLGISPELPVSAAALRTLLACPQRFLLERMIGFRPRTPRPDGHGVDAASYGALFHVVAEAFARTHGMAFGARHHDLPHWLAITDALACAAFDTFIAHYPLDAHAAARAARRRLRRDLAMFVTDDWAGGRPRTFVAAEHAFGDTPVAIATSSGALFVTGRIDRIDLDGAITLVRDLKTTRARPRAGEHLDPELELDLQLAVYAAATRGLAARLGVSEDVAAGYAYADPHAAVRQRAFREDRHVLEAAGERWFDVASGLIREQAYVRTPDRDRCKRCPFAVVCGDDGGAAAERLHDATGTLGAFRELAS